MSLSGFGPPGRDVRVTAFAADGTMIATHSESLAPSSNEYTVESWSTRLYDSVGSPLRLREGDRLAVVVGDETLSLDVPRLSGVAHVAEDLVAGQTRPNTEVSIYVAGGGGSVNTRAISDDNGLFSHNFSGGYDIAYNDKFVLGIETAEGHEIHRWTGTPGMLVDIDESSVTGTHELDTELTLELLGDSLPRATATAHTDPRSEFRALFRDERGNPVPPEPGNEIILRAAGAQANQTITMAVPELTIEIDDQAPSVGGRATYGGALAMRAYSSFRRTAGDYQPGSGGRAGVVMSPDGTYEAVFDSPSDGGPDFRPGQRFEAHYQLPDGHLADRMRYLPIANVQHGGAHVCGFAAPYESVTAQVIDRGGDRLATATGVVGYNSRFDLVIRDDAGRPFATEAGQTVRVQTGERVTDVSLPPLTVSADWHVALRNSSQAFTAVSVRGPRRADYYVTESAGDCFAGTTPHSVSGLTDIDGFFIRHIPMSDPGRGFEVAFYTAEGHRFYRNVRRSKASIYVHTDRVTGHASAFSPVSIELLDDVGSVRAQSDVHANERGSFDIHLQDTAGRPRLIDPGNVMKFEASGESASIDVDELNFDFSEGSGFIGIAPPDREVVVTLVLLDGRELTFNRRSDGRGRFEYTTDDIPPRGDWAFADVGFIRLALPTPGGHEIVREAVLKMPPLPYMAYLPWSGSRR